MEVSTNRRIKLESSVRNPILRALTPIATKFLEKTLCIDRLNEIYAQIQANEGEAKFVGKISCGGELGRSFVRPEYQRGFHPLMLLWKGIARFVARHPQYGTLFGVVSMPNDYTTISRQLMVAFLKANHHGSGLARYVKPRNPLKPKLAEGNEIKKALRLFRDIQDLSELVSDIEDDQKGVPFLFKQYLKLGGRFVGYNVDPNFSNVLDALILVDVTRTERRLLERYMGKDRATAFFNYHGPQSMEDCA